jgi:hypothetical protein
MSRGLKNQALVAILAALQIAGTGQIGPISEHTLEAPAVEQNFDLCYNGGINERPQARGEAAR